MMDTVLFDFGGWVITPWKLVGYLGVGCFGLRWLVQIVASARERRAVVPVVFWLITLCGASFQLSYFVWGKNDSVGILASVSPILIAAYNLYLELGYRKDRRVDREGVVTEGSKDG